jgi:hypothetical protein
VDRVFAIAKGGEGMPCHALSTRSGAGTVRVKSCVDRVCNQHSVSNCFWK